MLTLQALTYIERQGQTSRTIWNYTKGTLTPAKGLNTMLNWIMLSISTAEKCAPMQVVKQPESSKASDTEEQKCSLFQLNYD